MDIPSDLIPIRCSNCGKKIGEVKMIIGTVSIVCPKCKTVNIHTTKSTQSTNS